MIEVKENSLKAYVIESIMFLSYAFFAVSWIAGTTLTPQIMTYFNLETFASATFISNAITIAKIIGNLMAAWILLKLKPKWAIAFASLLISVGTAAGAFVTEYWMFIVTRFIMGFGGALFIVYFGPIVLRYFTTSKRTMINGINAAAYNIGSIIAMILVAPVILWLVTFQNSLLFFAGCSFILFILWLLFGENFETTKTVNETTTEKVEDYTFKSGLKDKINYTLPFTYSGLLLLYIVILTIFPSSDLAAVDAKVLSTTVAIAGVVGSAVGIIIMKYISSRLQILRWSGLIMTIAAFLMIMTDSSIIAIILAAIVGLAMFLPMTALVTIPQELPNITPQKLTVIMGFFWSISYMIETVLYYFIGLIIDNAGFKTGLLVAIACSLTFFIGSFLLPETKKTPKIVDDKAEAKENLV